MVFEYELPDVGEGVAEGEIVAWHVEVGDRVEEDQVLAEVETDKAVVDLPSPVDGVIEELHAEAGEIVEVGSVVVTIETEGDVDADDVTTEDESPDAGVTEGETSADVDAAATDAKAESGAVDDAAAAGAGDGRVFAPPNVRRLARELGVDITAVEGSGPSGRITEGDVRAAAEREGKADEEGEPERKQAAVKRTEADSPAGTAGTGATEATGAGAAGEAVPGDAETAGPGTTGADVAADVEAADRDRTLAAPATRRVAGELDVDIDEVPTEKTRDGEAFVEPEDVQAYAEAQQAAQAADARATAETGMPAGVDGQTEAREPVEAGEQVTREPYRGIRRTIGQRMAESVYTAPHATHHDDAEVSALVEARAQLKERAEQQDVKLTYMPFIMKAVLAALKEYPMLNSELDEENEEILYKHFYNVGIAVATDAGLMVPVVENVDQKGLLQLAAETNDLAARARERELTPEEMRGGTFTLTNFGAIGGEYAKPVINYPETAILGLGAIEERPVAVDGEVVARPTLPLSLSIDHRVIDGAEAAQFCNTVIEYLENPTLLLLE